MNTSLLCALLVLCPQSPDPADEARKWIERLDSAPTDAVAALVQLGPEASAAALVEALRSEPPATGWHAARALRGLGAAAGKRDRALEAAAASLAEVAVDEGATLETRELAALAFGGVARYGRSSDVCDEVLGGDDGMRVRLAMAASLGGCEKDTVKAVQKTMKKRPFFASTLALAALGVMGEKASSAKGDLVRLIGEDESLHSFLLLMTTRFVVGELGMPSLGRGKAWSKRARKESGRTWRGGKGGLNVGGLMPRKPEAALSFLQAQSGFGGNYPAAKMSLPSAFDSDPDSSLFTVGHMLQNLSKHLAQEICTLDEGLAEQRWKSWDEWVEHTRPVVMTAEFLAEFEQRFLPDPK